MRDHKQWDEASGRAATDAGPAPGKQSLTEQIDRAAPVAGPGKQTLTAQVQRMARGEAGPATSQGAEGAFEVAVLDTAVAGDGRHPLSAIAITTAGNIARPIPGLSQRRRSHAMPSAREDRGGTLRRTYGRAG